MEKEYAQALWQMVEAGKSPKEAVAAVHRVLAASGRRGLLPGIARALEQLAAKRREAEGVVLSVAREKDEHAARHAVKELLAELRVEPKDVALQVDDSLIGGWRLEGRERLVDASFKKQLLSLYNRATRA